MNWRQGIAVSLAILSLVLWMVLWIGGWLLGGLMFPRYEIPAAIGALIGFWGGGFGIAVLWVVIGRRLLPKD